MSRPRDLARRDELLAAVVADCAERGLGHRSLRDIARHAGTSHRMLIHHFGSREDLMVAVVQAVEARQVELATTEDGPAATQLRQMWAHLSQPALRPLERLFFESYARAANGETPFDRLLPGAVESWLPADDRDPALRRLALAVMRGLLLDLVATEDHAGTTAAVERFATLVAAGDASPSPPGQRRRANP